MPLLRMKELWSLRAYSYHDKTTIRGSGKAVVAWQIQDQKKKGKFHPETQSNANRATEEASGQARQEVRYR